MIVTNRLKICSVRSSATFHIWGRVSNCWSESPGVVQLSLEIHLVNHGAALSQGAIESDIPGVNVAAERVSTAIVKSLFAEDIGAIRQALEAFDEPELRDTPFFVPR